MKMMPNMSFHRDCIRYLKTHVDIRCVRDYSGGGGGGGGGDVQGHSKHELELGELTVYQV